MRKSVILITGANGEIGHGLISSLQERYQQNIVALDLKVIDPEIRPHVKESIAGNILDKALLDQINAEYQISEIYHLAALLSTRAEFSPVAAHDVNVGGTLNLLELAVQQARSHGQPVKFFFPSSIAVYGIPSLKIKQKITKIHEDEYCFPETMYGCNKLYCESLGAYYSKHYQRLSDNSLPGLVDFRGMRFPGLISAVTVPSGGTSDFAPEMIHAAIQHHPYDCFVRPDTTIPFMTMPDAIRSILELMSAPKSNLTRQVYNITGWSASADKFRDKMQSVYSDANITFTVNEKRQSIVDSWPADVDDSAAQKDWGWQPEHHFQNAFDDYLLPGIKAHYGK
ncbi:MAG: NAD-dependent epimerase/dehydratase family protein [Candidatus Marinimicrobia bacterium]|nr:NAD-dependent epimerase/dehydratase family protein [Candidatus Neomarinimicrobiota bacterium]